MMRGAIILIVVTVSPTINLIMHKYGIFIFIRLRAFAIANVAVAI